MKTKKEEQEKKSNLLNAEALVVTEQSSAEESDSLILNSRRGESDKIPRRQRKTQIEKKKEMNDREEARRREEARQSLHMLFCWDFEKNTIYFRSLKTDSSFSLFFYLNFFIVSCSLNRSAVVAIVECTYIKSDAPWKE